MAMLGHLCGQLFLSAPRQVPPPEAFATGHSAPELDCGRLAFLCASINRLASSCSPQVMGAGFTEFYTAMTSIAVLVIAVALLSKTKLV